MKELPSWNYAEILRSLLEDFEPTLSGNQLALVSARNHSPILYENVDAAVKATALRLPSIDYVKKEYGIKYEQRRTHGTVLKAYTDCYYIAKNYMSDAIKQLKSSGKDEPTVGEFGASLVLERLTTSLFSAHLLYQLGHRYEGHAVSRLMLEQIAWAYVAYPMNDMDSISKLSSTKSINKLKKINDKVGKLYGFLSKKTHIGYESHHEFLSVNDEKNVIFHAQREYAEYAYILLKLVDLMVLVWEISQFRYLDKVVSVLRDGSNLIPDENREFLDKAKKGLESLKSVIHSNDDKNNR